LAQAGPAAMADYNSRASGEELGDEDLELDRGREPLPPLDVYSWTGVLNLGTGMELPLYLDLSSAEDGDSQKPGRILQQYLSRDQVFMVQVKGTAANGEPMDPVGCKHNKAVLRRTLLAAIMSVHALTPFAGGEVEIIVTYGGQQVEFNTPFGLKKTLPVKIISPDENIRFPASGADGGEATDTLDMRGNSLASISLAEDHHESFQVIDNGHEVAVLITKTDPADFATVFVFGLKGGKARLDRYETAETNLDSRPKWDFVDTCQLGEVLVSSQGDLTIVQISEGVEFVFEPRTLKQAYSANLHVGPMVFAAITCVGESWIQWFSKKWVPCVAIGDPEESGMIERFAAPTVSSLTKRQRGIRPTTIGS